MALFGNTYEGVGCLVTSISEAYSRANKYMINQTDLGHFSGSILIAKQGKVILNKGYAMANLEHEIPNTPTDKIQTWFYK